MDCLFDANAGTGQTQVFEVRAGGACRRGGKAAGKFSGGKARREPQRFEVMKQDGGSVRCAGPSYPDHAVKASRSVKRGFLRLATLAPDITQAILDGREPDGLSYMKRVKVLTYDWDDQRQVLGFT